MASRISTLTNSSNRKKFSRIEERLRHRRQQNLREVKNSGEGTFVNDLNDYSPFAKNKSFIPFGEEKLDISTSSENSSGLREDKEKINLSVMKNRRLLCSGKRNLCKIVCKSKNRNRNSRLRGDKPQNLPCDILFRIKCAKQVKSVKKLDKVKSSIDEKFETSSTRCACSTSRMQKEQLDSPYWEKSIKELKNKEKLISNEYLKTKRSTQIDDIFKSLKKNNSKISIEANLISIDDDSNKKNTSEDNYKNIPEEVYQNSDQIESELKDSTQFLHISENLSNRQLNLKGCEDDFSDGPLSSPEKTTCREDRFRWNTVLEKQLCHSNSLAVVRPRSEHLGIKCCSSFKRRYCSCGEKPLDLKPFENDFKKQNNNNHENKLIVNADETTGSEKMSLNKKTIAMEDAACSPRKSFISNLDIGGDENNYPNDSENQSPITSRSVSTQVENDLIIEYNKKQNYQCQNCIISKSVVDSIFEEKRESAKCAICRKHLEIEDVHENCCRSTAAVRKQSLLNVNKDYVNVHDMNYCCNCESQEHKNNLHEKQRRNLNFVLPLCNHAFFTTDVHCLRNKILKNNCRCVNYINNDEFERTTQCTNFECLPSYPHFHCDRDDIYNCVPKVNTNYSGRKLSCHHSNDKHKILQEASSQTGFRKCMCNDRNDSDDWDEKINFQKKNFTARRFPGNSSTSLSKVESLSKNNSPTIGKSTFTAKTFFPPIVGDRNRSFCEQIVNKHQDILKSCMRNERQESKLDLNVDKNIESDSEWSASPEEDFSINEVIFPKETRIAMNWLRQGEDNLPQESHINEEHREQVMREEFRSEQGKENTKNKKVYTSMYAKALAVFQNGHVPPVQPNFKKNRSQVSKNDTSDK